MCVLLLVSKVCVETIYDFSLRCVIWTVLSVWIPWQYLQSTIISTKAATTFLLFDSKVCWKGAHTFLTYKLHHQVSTNHEQTRASTAWLTAATPISMLCFQTYITKQTYQCHLPCETPTLCWMHHLKRKEYQVSKLLKAKHNQCFKSFMNPHRMLTDSHNSFLIVLNTGN